MYVALLTSPIAKLIDEGFTRARHCCLHWLVLGGRWRCFYSDTDRRAPFPCRLPIGCDWDHPSSWKHHDGRRLIYIEPYGLSNNSIRVLSKFAAKYSLAIEIAPCLRGKVPAIGIRIESQGGRPKLPRPTAERQAELCARRLWEWEVAE
jgi:hypothetical protein